jgi:hypothetical protein
VVQSVVQGVELEDSEEQEEEGLVWGIEEGRRGAITIKVYVFLRP